MILMIMVLMVVNNVICGDESSSKVTEKVELL